MNRKKQFDFRQRLHSPKLIILRIFFFFLWELYIRENTIFFLINLGHFEIYPLPGIFWKWKMFGNPGFS